MIDVSIITATYNGQNFIEETLHSVFSQKGVNLELIVIDDASNDSTSDIVKKKLNSSPFPSNLITHNQNKGSKLCWQEGISISKGKFFKTLGGDDTLPSEYTLKNQLDIFDQYQNLALVTGSANHMDKDSKIYLTSGYKSSSVLDKNSVLWDIKLGKPRIFYAGANLVRKEAYFELGKVVDLSYVVRVLLSDNWQIFYMKDPVLNYRRHRGNITNNPLHRFKLMKLRNSLAAEIHENYTARNIQRAYWICLEMIKIGYSMIGTKK